MEMFVTVFFVWSFVLLVGTELLTLQMPNTDIAPYTLIYQVDGYHRISIPIYGYHKRIVSKRIKGMRGSNCSFRLFQEGDEMFVLVQKGSLEFENEIYTKGESFSPGTQRFTIGNTVFYIKRGGSI